MNFTLKATKIRLPFFLSIFALLALWQIFSLIISNSIICPSPFETFLRLLKLCRDFSFWQSVSFSVLRVFAAFSLILVFGGAAGILSGIFPFFRDFLSLPLAVIRSVPVVSFILLAIFAFNSGFVPVFSAFLMGFPVMTGALASGFEFNEETKKLFFMAEIFHLKKSQKIRFILIPHLNPFLKTGIFSSFGMCWKVVAAAEVLSMPKNALGAVLQNAQVHLESAEVLAATAVLVALSFLTEKILSLIFKILIQKITTENSKKYLGRFPPLRFGPGFARFRFRSIPSLFSAILRFFQSKDKPNPKNSSASKQNPLRNASGGATIPNALPVPVKIKNLTISFGGKTLFKDFSIIFEAGKTTAILSPSGSGKTTLLNWIAQNSLKNAHLKSQSNDFSVSFLFQEPRLLPTLTVFENVFLPLSNIFPKEKAANLAKKILDAAELSDKLERSTENLSGGEKQRVAMARAFSFPSNILLLDEAFQSLDEKIKFSLEKTLKKLLNQKPRTVIFATHQQEEAQAIADRIVKMNGCPLQIIEKSS